jgi:hypothetical protein
MFTAVANRDRRGGPSAQAADARAKSAGSILDLEAFVFRTAAPARDRARDAAGRRAPAGAGRVTAADDGAVATDATAVMATAPRRPR